MSKTVCQNTLPFHSHRNITARFDGGSLTSDAGWFRNDKGKVTRRDHAILTHPGE